MSSTSFQEQWFSDYTGSYYGYNSSFHTSAGPASSSSRTVEATCASCYGPTPCRCYAWNNSRVESCSATTWHHRYPDYNSDSAGDTNNPVYQNAYTRSLSVDCSRSGVDTPSSTYSSPIYTPGPGSGHSSSTPAIEGQDAQYFYDAFLQNIAQFEPHCKLQPATAAYSDVSESTAVQGTMGTNCPTAAPDYGDPQLTQRSALSLDDLLSQSQQLYPSSLPSATSTSLPSSAQFTFSIPPSQLSLTSAEIPPQLPMLHQPRPTWPITLLEDMKKAQFSLTDPVCDPRGAVRGMSSSSLYGALGELSQTLASTSLIELGAHTGNESRSQTVPEDDEFNDGEDDSSSEFEGGDYSLGGSYEEPEQSYVPPTSDSPLPLLCQPVSDELMYQAEGSPYGRTDPQGYLSSEAGPYGVTRSRQMYDEENEDAPWGSQFGSANKRRRLNC